VQAAKCGTRARIAGPCTLLATYASVANQYIDQQARDHFCAFHSSTCCTQ
jgi:hypothetical protein